MTCSIFAGIEMAMGPGIYPGQRGVRHSSRREEEREGSSPPPPPGGAHHTWETLNSSVRVLTRQRHF